LGDEDIINIIGFSIFD